MYCDTDIARRVDALEEENRNLKQQLKLAMVVFLKSSPNPFYSPLKNFFATTEGGIFDIDGEDEIDSIGRCLNAYHLAIARSGGKRKAIEEANVALGKCLREG